MPAPVSSSLHDLLGHLEDYLTFQQELGAPAVEISSETLDALRDIAASSAPPVPPPAEPRSRKPAVAPSIQPAAPQAPPRPPGNPAEQLEAIAEELRQSDFCPLKASAINTVPGQGNPSPELVFIGEAPGKEEDEQGLAFVGESGKLLTRLITAMGLSRDEVWIGNIVKWRPPNNRPPTVDEIQSCLPYLIRQLDILKPTVIVCLGGVSAKALLETTEGIMKLRGHWQEFNGIPLLPTYHPAFLLRSLNRQQKDRYWEVWQDMEAVLIKLGRPLPEKKKR